MENGSLIDSHSSPVPVVQSIFTIKGDMISCSFQSQKFNQPVMGFFGKGYVVIFIETDGCFDVGKIMAAIGAGFHMGFNSDAFGGIEFLAKIVADMLHYFFTCRFVLIHV
jgi:hypothetical protein